MICHSVDNDDDCQYYHALPLLARDPDTISIIVIMQRSPMKAHFVGSWLAVAMPIFTGEQVFPAIIAAERSRGHSHLLASNRTGL